MNDASEMCVLNRLTHSLEKSQPFGDTQFACVTKFRDRFSLDKLHCEVGSTCLGHSAIKQFGDVGMVHHSERLALLLESRENNLGIHSSFDEFECDALHKRNSAFREPHLAETTLADLRD